MREAGLSERVRFLVSDDCFLSLILQARFDAVLLMGPLYHLVEVKDRRKALREAFIRLKPGALIFSTFISRYGIFGDLLMNMPEWIEEREEIQTFLERCSNAVFCHFLSVFC